MDLLKFLVKLFRSHKPVEKEVPIIEPVYVRRISTVKNNSTEYDNLRLKTKRGGYVHEVTNPRFIQKPEGCDMHTVYITEKALVEALLCARFAGGFDSPVPQINSRELYFDVLLRPKSLIIEDFLVPPQSTTSTHGQRLGDLERGRYKGRIPHVGQSHHRMDAFHSPPDRTNAENRLSLSIVFGRVDDLPRYSPYNLHENRKDVIDLLVLKFWPCGFFQRSENNEVGFRVVRSEEHEIQEIYKNLGFYGGEFEKNWKSNPRRGEQLSVIDLLDIVNTVCPEKARLLPSYQEIASSLTKSIRASIRENELRAEAEKTQEAIETIQEYLSKMQSNLRPGTNVSLLKLKRIITKIESNKRFNASEAEKYLERLDRILEYQDLNITGFENETIGKELPCGVHFNPKELVIPETLLDTLRDRYRNNISSYLFGYVSDINDETYFNVRRFGKTDSKARIGSVGHRDLPLSKVYDQDISFLIDLWFEGEKPHAKIEYGVPCGARLERQLNIRVLKPKTPKSSMVEIPGYLFRFDRY